MLLILIMKLSWEAHLRLRSCMLSIGWDVVTMILLSYTVHFYYVQVDLRFGNVVADDVFFVSGYDIYGTVVAQVGSWMVLLLIITNTTTIWLHVCFKFWFALFSKCKFLSWTYLHFLRQGNPILGVHLYLYSNDVTEVPCPQGFSDAPREGALCHAISGADGKFTFRSLPCGKLIISWTNKMSP